MYTLAINELANLEYSNAYDWYETQSDGLGDRFECEVEQIIEAILKNPFLFNVTKRNYREAVVSVFPYSVVYTVRKRTNTVYITAIFHTSRNPRFKFRKPK